MYFLWACSGYGCQVKAQHLEARPITMPGATGQCEIRTQCYVHEIAMNDMGR